VSQRSAKSPDAAVLALAGALTSGAMPTYAALKKGLQDAAATDPFDATMVTVLGGSFLFYLAEKGKNPKVETFWDALVFITTCLSVGYADVFARTPTGKAIAAAVMTFGPALSGAIFEQPPPGQERKELGPEVVAFQRAIVDKLDAILVELRAKS
jgi:voltage-gated potassium channel